MNGDFRLLPEQASTMAPHVDLLFFTITGICVFFTLLIAVLLLTFAIKYRRRSEDFFPTPIVGSKILEITWSVIPLGIVMVIFVWGAWIYLNMRRTPDNALEVYVIGKQWMWQCQHTGGQREINALHVPLGRPVKLIMTSEDVLHDFYIPAFRTKMDVVPGRYTYMWFEPTKTGTYHLFCALYCGTEHSRMVGEVVVMEPSDYETWLAERADRSLALQGRQLFGKLQCITCHYTEAGNRAPVLEGLFGRKVQLQDGSTVLADEAYIRESILVPTAKVRAGFRPIMPSFEGQVSQDDLIKLVAYIKSLRPGDTPPRVEESLPPATDKELDNPKPPGGEKSEKKEPEKNKEPEKK
jgi:cytochrome c oxidase subunit II